jgi:hypothetical protein
MSKDEIILPQVSRVYNFSTKYEFISFPFDYNEFQGYWCCEGTDKFPYIPQRNTNYGRISNYIFDNPGEFSNLGQILDEFGDNYPNSYYTITPTVKLYGEYEPCCSISCGDRELQIRGRSSDFGAAAGWQTVFDTSNDDISADSPITGTFNMPTFNGRLSRELDYEWRLFYDNNRECKTTNLNIKIEYKVEVNDLFETCKETRFYDKYFCRTWCTNNENACIEATNKYCFNENAFVLQSRYFNNDTRCVSKVTSDYAKRLSNITPNYEATLTKICGNLFDQGIITPEFINTGQSSKLTNPTLKLRIRDACACRLPSSVYSGFRLNLLDLYPLLEQLQVGNFKCLFPQCGTSLLKPADVQGENGCPQIQCLNLISVNNDGTFRNVIISQDNRCNSLRVDTTTSPPQTTRPPSTGTPGPTTRTPITPQPTIIPTKKPFSNNYTIIIIVVVVFILIIILGFAVLFLSGGKKKIKKKI